MTCRLLPAALALLLCGAVALAAQEEKPAPAPAPAPAPGPASPGQDLPPEEELVDEGWLKVNLRFGGWRSSGFKAQTPMGLRRIKPDLLADVGLDLRAEYYGWSVTLGGDYATSQDLRMVHGGLLLGTTMTITPEEYIPMDLMVGIGPGISRLTVNESDFGRFKSTLGVDARVELIGRFWENAGVALWAEYRQVSFKYQEPVLTGETRTGGVTVAFGAAFVFRF